MRAFIKMFERVSQPINDKKYSYDDNTDINYISMTGAQQKAFRIKNNRKHTLGLWWQLAYKNGIFSSDTYDKLFALIRE